MSADHTPHAPETGSSCGSAMPDTPADSRGAAAAAALHRPPERGNLFRDLNGEKVDTIRFALRTHGLSWSIREQHNGDGGRATSGVELRKHFMDTC
jgi:hypothetical protein